MKVYVSSHCVQAAQELAAKLAAAGHHVVSEWHAGESPRVPLDDAATWKAKADRNFQLIETADVLALVSSPDHVSGAKRVAGGKFVEAGYAMKEGVRVITVGAIENGMMHYGEAVADADTLLSLICEKCPD